MKKIKRTPEYTVGSGNVFRDLGLPNPEEELTKSSLLIEIHRTIKARGLKQVEAARILGIPQPKVSNLLRGYPTGFSVHRLSLLLAKLGKSVTLVVSDEPPPAGPLHIPVVRDSAGLVGRLAKLPVATDDGPARRYSASGASRPGVAKPQRPRTRTR